MKALAEPVAHLFDLVQAAGGTDSQF